MVRSCGWYLTNIPIFVKYSMVICAIQIQGAVSQIVKIKFSSPKILLNVPKFLLSMKPTSGNSLCKRN